MTVDTCVWCGQRIEPGSTKCLSCGGNLEKPGTMKLILGWLLVAISSIPFGVAFSAAVETGMHWPALFPGVAVVFLGVVMVAWGRAQNLRYAEEVKAARGSGTPPPG